LVGLTGSGQRQALDGTSTAPILVQARDEAAEDAAGALLDRFGTVQNPEMAALMKVAISAAKGKP
jgi:hypothetical protein